MKNTREHPTEQGKTPVDSDGRPPLQGAGIEKQWVYCRHSPALFRTEVSESVRQTNQGGTAEIMTRPLQQLLLCNGRVFAFRINQID